MDPLLVALILLIIAGVCFDGDPIVVLIFIIGFIWWLPDDTDVPEDTQDTSTITEPQVQPKKPKDLEKECLDKGGIWLYDACIDN